MKFGRSLGIIEPIPALELSPRKVRMFIYLQHVYNLFNSIGICNFVAHPWGPVSNNDLVDYVNAVTGWDTSLWELMKVGERYSNMARLFNNREGFSPKDDTLPDRFFQPLPAGPLAGVKLDPEEFRNAIAMYYQEMGWDESGAPIKGQARRTRTRMDHSFRIARRVGRLLGDRNWAPLEHFSVRGDARGPGTRAQVPCDSRPERRTSAASSA